jgi:uncharacterized membrane protein
LRPRPVVTVDAPDQRELDPRDDDERELPLLLLALLRSLRLLLPDEDDLREDLACERSLSELLLLREELPGISVSCHRGSPYGAVRSARQHPCPCARAATRTIAPSRSTPTAMLVLIAGLVLFLGPHSVRIVADDWRSARLAALGEKRWKGIYSLVSIAGFVLIVWGYGLARRDPAVLWAAPTWGRHAAPLLMLVAFILLPAANVPRNHVKAAVHHPMVLAVLVWSVAHLLANNTLADLVLFGAFLAWSVLDFLSARARDRAQGVAYPPGSARGTLITVVAGVVVWAVFAFWAHAFLFGVRPLP